MPSWDDFDGKSNESLEAESRGRNPKQEHQGAQGENPTKDPKYSGIVTDY